MSESAVDWTRLMNEANSDGNFVFIYCNILTRWITKESVGEHDEKRS